MEYLRGGTLADKLQRGAVPLEFVIALALKLAEALEHVHDAGILHRDIKPENIAFSHDGAPKLLDFGVARELRLDEPLDQAFRVPDFAEASLSLTSASEIVGTIPYLSPEAILSHDHSPSVDLWALSMVVYEAIAGRHPLIDGPVTRILYRITQADVPDVREYAPNAPEGIALFLRECFNADRQRRPASAREWRKKLARSRQSGARPLELSSLEQAV